MTKARYRLMVSLCLILIGAGLAQANWSEKFTGGKYDLSTWQFNLYPAIAWTFNHTLATGPDGNSYLVLNEPLPPTQGGCGFGVGLPSPEEFTDVRVGAVVNVTGDASRNYHALGARINYFVDTGMITGIPGIVASGYVLLVHWEDGPANLRIEVRKLVNLNQEVMRTRTEVVVPTVDNAHRYYAQLEVVGANPVYITGSLYASQGGALVARTPTLVDTDRADPWENAGVHDAVFAKGVSLIFGANQVVTHPGFHCTFDDISSVSDGPAAALRSPDDGDVDVPVNAVLRWVEGAFATGREVWFGPQGAMQKVTPDPQGTSYVPALLETGQSYEWRVDEIGAAGTVTGAIRTFTVGNNLAVDDFESYDSDAQIAAAWPQNITGVNYVFREMATVRKGAGAMRFTCQNQYAPFFTEATHTFDTPQDWTAHGAARLSLTFCGDPNNAEQPLYVRVQDNTGKSATVTYASRFAVQSRYWRLWEIQLSDLRTAGVDLAAVTKLTIGVGEGKASSQKGEDTDVVYIDDIRLVRVFIGS